MDKLSGLVTMVALLYCLYRLVGFLVRGLRDDTDDNAAPYDVVSRGCAWYQRSDEWGYDSACGQLWGRAMVGGVFRYCPACGRLIERFGLPEVRTVLP